MIRVHVSRRGGLGRGARGLEPALRKALARAVAEGAADLRATARGLLDESGNGQASRPGEAPHRQSGRLRDSIFVRLGKDGLSAEVGTDLPYGRDLEFGTRRMAARPWLQPAVEAAKPRILARLRAALRILV